MPQYPYLRMRRNRKDEWSRKLIKENTLLPENLILPIFVQEGRNIRTPIASMPGVERVSLDIAIDITKKARDLGISAVILFPYIDVAKKSKGAEEAVNPDNLICRAIQEIKNNVDGIGVIVDIALDPYTIHGHDGIIDESGYVINDETVEILSKQALNFAMAGCDMVAPSDMMDGKIKKIRQMLEAEGLHNVQIMSYSAKYASNFYGPFRDAVGSSGLLTKGDKKNYQMDFSNSNEALRQISIDIEEGADLVIIKPGMPYLDIIRAAKDTFNIPIVAYQVSGEYTMLRLAAEHGAFKLSDIFFESMIAMKRAGANAIITYAALDVAMALSA